MNLKIGWTCFWRTAVSCLLVLDFFLFTTGNPSVTYSFVGGWFELVLIAAVIITVSYGYEVLKGSEAKSHFILHLLVIGLFSIALLILSQQAKVFASDRLEAQIALFVKDPINSEAGVSDLERNLMVEIKKRKYSMERETFIPTFRRMDYFFKTETSEKYRLIMTMSWKGIPQISFRRVDS